MAHQGTGSEQTQTWTNPLKKHSKRHSWWPRRDAPTSSTTKQEHPNQDRNKIIRSESVQADSLITQIDTIPLSEHVAPPAHGSRKITKSEGSVGSNLKNLSINNQQALPPSLSPSIATRMKRPADPSGQTPEGETPRPSKRAPNQSTVAVDGRRNKSTGVHIYDSDGVTAKSEPGVVKPSKPKAFSQTSSDAVAYANDDYLEPTGTMLLEPETRPITQDQLVNEVKGIYAGLVMVEKKCVEIDQQQSKTTNKLSDDQWQALIALHRTLLYEHHDFFLASQHPSASPALRRLASKYAMPARMWRHGIHSFLELLRHRLPDSLDHMLAFVYLAYSMMALLMESVPSFVETWIECLGDLARYRMAIEEVDLRDREIWSGCAKMWYEKAADKSPNVGRIQHHLAVLARPNIVQQLFYYSKALVSVVPFQNARESVMLLFNPFLQETETISQKYIAVEAAFVTFHGVLFTLGLRKLYSSNIEIFLSGFDAHIGRTGPKFRTQGPEAVSSLCAAALVFGNPEAPLMKAFQVETERRVARVTASKEDGSQEQSTNEFQARLDQVRQDWISPATEPSSHADAKMYTSEDFADDSKISGVEEASAQAIGVLFETTRIVSQRIGDKNIVPYMHTLLAFLWSLAHVPGALQYVQGSIPWDGLVNFLNTLGRSGVDESRVIGDEFPQQLSGTGRQLPEDFPMRGLLWAQHYYPATFFQGQVVDEDERTLDLPSHAAPRAERCLWLGYQLARLNRWIAYNKESRQFSIIELSLDYTLSVHSDKDTKMQDIWPT